MKSIPIN